MYVILSNTEYAPTVEYVDTLEEAVARANLVAGQYGYNPDEVVEICRIERSLRVHTEPVLVPWVPNPDVES